jgi:hypothetical protein
MPPFKPNEKTLLVAKQLATSIENRYATMSKILDEGKVYNPLGAIKRRALRTEDGEPFERLHDDRHITILDPWFISTDELVSDLQWQKEQLERQMSNPERMQLEQALSMDKESPSIPLTHVASDESQGDLVMSLNEVGKAGPSLPPLIQRKGISSVSPSLSPASTPPQSPNINNYPDSAFDGMLYEEDEGRGLADKRRSWSKSFFKRDKGKLKLKPEADAEVKRRYRNEDFLRHTQMTSSKGRGSSPQLPNISDSTLGDQPAPFGQTLLVPIDRHVNGPRGHRRSVSTMDVLPVPTPRPLGTPEPYASADVSEADLSSEDARRRPRLRSRRHSFDSLKLHSSKSSHRHFAIWSDRHRNKKSPLCSDNEQADDVYGKQPKGHFIRSANNSESESDSNESDIKGHHRSKKGLGIRHFLKKETEFTV